MRKKSEDTITSTRSLLFQLMMKQKQRMRQSHHLQNSRERIIRVEKADFAVTPERGMIQIDQEAISLQAIDRPDTLDVSETESAKDNNESCLYGSTTGAWQVVGHDLWIRSD